MFSSSDFVKRLLVAELATSATIQGCSQAEVDLVETRFKIKLPAVYVDFLRTAGKQAGVLFLPDIDILFPKILELREIAIEALNIFEGGKLVLPQNSFVFADRYGEQFMFFESDTGSDDPIVYRYSQGRHHFEKLDSHFSEIIEERLEFMERFRKTDPGSPYWDYLKNGCKGPLIWPASTQHY